MYFLCVFEGRGWEKERGGREDGGWERQKDAFLGHKVNSLREGDRRESPTRLSM